MPLQVNNTICQDKPIKIINILDDNRVSIMKHFKKIGQLRFENKYGNKPIRAIAQYQVNLSNLDELDEEAYKIAYNAILYAVRYLVNEFNNSEPQPSNSNLFLQQYLNEINNIKDEFLYIDNLNKNERIRYYE